MREVHLELVGKVAVVTGASGGIGATLARRFAEAGANVAICARNISGLAETREAVIAAGPACLPFACDIRIPGDVAHFARAVLERFGQVDVLVNNAAVLGPRVSLAKFPVEQWKPVIDINVNGTFYVLRAFLPAMLAAGGGSIITVTSGVGNVGKAHWGAYGVSKFAQEGLALALAAELEGTGVRSNLVDPGPTRTRMRAAAYPAEDAATLRTPDQIAPVFLWLASDASRQVNGQRFQARRFEEDKAAELSRGTSAN